MAHASPAVLSSTWSTLLQSIREGATLKAARPAASVTMNQSLLQSIRDAWFDRQMKAREPDFTDLQSLRCGCVVAMER
jgi:hypothetical protein